jgi:hypothetical protein
VQFERLSSDIDVTSLGAMVQGLQPTIDLKYRVCVYYQCHKCDIQVPVCRQDDLEKFRVLNFIIPANIDLP